jgi:hypothetical protein
VQYRNLLWTECCAVRRLSGVLENPRYQVEQWNDIYVFRRRRVFGNTILRARLIKKHERSAPLVGHTLRLTSIRGQVGASVLLFSHDDERYHRWQSSVANVDE